MPATRHNDAVDSISVATDKRKLQRNEIIIDTKPHVKITISGNLPPTSPPAIWNQLGSKIQGDAPGSQSGTRIALNEVGTILAVLTPSVLNAVRT